MRLNLDTLELAIDDDRIVHQIKVQSSAWMDEGTRFFNHELSPGKYKTYAEYFGCYVRGRWVHVRYSPRFENCPRAILQFHTSEFVDFIELLAWLRLLAGDCLKEVLLAKLTRSDFCIDVAIPIDSVISCLSRTGTQFSVHYHGKRKSICIGKRPYRTNIYAKEINLLRMDYLPKNLLPENKLFHGSRIESQFTGKKVKAECLSDLAENFSEIKGFPRLKLESPIEMIADINLKQKRLCEAFLYNVDLHGFHEARNEFNRPGRNFTKTIGRFLSPIDLNPEVALQDRLQRFFSAAPSREMNEEGKISNWNWKESDMNCVGDIAQDMLQV